MMTDSAALARQLAELDKVAVSADWTPRDYEGNWQNWYENPRVLELIAGEEVYEHTDSSVQDEDTCRLVAALRNNLPAILRALCVMAAVNSIRAESTAPFDYDDVQERADELLAECTGAK